MKLSFSTRGWIDRSWDELVDLAQRMDFHGIEVYNAQGIQELSGKGGPFHKYDARATVRDLRKIGL